MKQHCRHHYNLPCPMCTPKKSLSNKYCQTFMKNIYSLKFSISVIYTPYSTKESVAKGKEHFIDVKAERS